MAQVENFIVYLSGENQVSLMDPDESQIEMNLQNLIQQKSELNTLINLSTKV